ncbi:MAG TPA: hypothetical protein P5050_07865 [Bacteroidia bacterium]|nr:hypothetical protein [Sphingobacteriales bacterium]HPD65465.1 hypothetical protein [Bacteroidia bacterium]HRS59120.1 hypothetical protein [Bacteroidia bacterium]HRU67416.1 hypothetical protein [Bacteroidia bacterium]
MKHNNLTRLLALSLLITGIYSDCEKNNNYHGIPDVYVNFSINLNLPAYSGLNVIGGYYLFENEGYKGIIVYHAPDDLFYALETACPYHPMDSCAEVTPDLSGIFLRCGHYEGNDFFACCGSNYDMYGNVIKDPAVYPLKRYKTQRDGDMVYVFN